MVLSKLLNLSRTMPGSINCLMSEFYKREVSWSKSEKVTAIVASGR